VISSLLLSSPTIHALTRISSGCSGQITQNVWYDSSVIFLSQVEHGCPGVFAKGQVWDYGLKEYLVRVCFLINMNHMCPNSERHRRLFSYAAYISISNDLLWRLLALQYTLIVSNAEKLMILHWIVYFKKNNCYSFILLFQVKKLTFSHKCLPPQTDATDPTDRVHRLSDCFAKISYACHFFSFAFSLIFISTLIW